MARRLWVYKTRNDPDTQFLAYGDWKPHLAAGKVFKWGGTWASNNTTSVRILESEMGVGDLVLAYQTDKRSVLGLCEVVKFTNGRQNLYLKPLEHYDPGVKIHVLKRANASLRRVRALQQGRIQTVYETDAKEASALLKACGSAYVGAVHS